MEDTTVVPAAVVEEVDWNSAIPISNTDAYDAVTALVAQLAVP
jgi:hypothetical protein